MFLKLNSINAAECAVVYAYIYKRVYVLCRGTSAMRYAHSLTRTTHRHTAHIQTAADTRFECCCDRALRNDIPIYAACSYLFIQRVYVFCVCVCLLCLCGKRMREWFGLGWNGRMSEQRQAEAATAATAPLSIYFPNQLLLNDRGRDFKRQRFQSRTRCSSFGKGNVCWSRPKIN